MAHYRCIGGDVWFSQSFRVRCCLPPCVKRTASCDLPFFFFSSRDFFPVILTFLRQLPFIGQFLNLPYIRPVRPFTPALHPIHFTLTHKWPRVLPARGSLSRLPYFRSVTDTTIISYYLTLLDSTATTVVVNARVYWILDTRSGYRASLSRLSSDNSLDVIRLRPHQAFSTHKHFLPLPSVFWSLPQSCDAAVPFRRTLRRLQCALGQKFGRGIAIFAVQRERNASDIWSSRRAQPGTSVTHTASFTVQKGREPRSSRDALRRPSESMAARTVLHITVTQT